MLPTARPLLLAALALGSPAAAENLLVNPDFHENRDSWTVDVGWNPAWVADDESGCAGSGSIYSLAQHGPSVVHWVWIVQCLPLPPDLSQLSLAGRYRADSLFPDVSIGVGFHDDLACEGPSLVGYGAGEIPPAVDTWRTLVESDFAVPPEAVAFEFSLYAITSVSFQIQFDALYLGEGAPIFRDDFEADLDGETQPCRWVPPLP